MFRRLTFQIKEILLNFGPLENSSSKYNPAHQHLMYFIVNAMTFHY